MTQFFGERKVELDDSRSMKILKNKNPKRIKTKPRKKEKGPKYCLINAFM